MSLQEYLSELYRNASRTIRADYATLREHPEDIGFFSTSESGRDFHHLTHEIIVSVQRFRDGRQHNLVFVGDHSIRLELEDQILENYYCDYVELRFILEGQLVVLINDQEHRFRTGEICFMNSRAYHRELLDRSECMVLNVNMSVRIFNDLFLNQIGIPRLQQFLRDHLVKRGIQERFLRFALRSEDSRRFIEDSFRAILQEAEEAQVGQMFFYQGYILQLMDHLAANYNVMRDQQDIQMYNDLLMESISNYLKDHLQNVTLDDLSRQYHYHPNFFTSLIRRYYGITFSDYLLHLRIDRAKELLKDTSLNIDEIIYLVGYSNRSFFTRKFTEQAGISPAKFRKDSRPSAHAKKEDLS